ncbi:MAG: PilZ domain-containing protein [Bryobacteraceae bacterium]|jgi:hypothetical protein
MCADHPRPNERRAEPRRPAQGDVTLWLNGSRLATVSGRLLDIAKSGFRAQHRSLALLPGHEVEFEVNGVTGRARVVWTRILGEQVESGFLILARDAG